MRLDIAKHALQGILACSDWNKLIAQAAKELGQTMQDVAAEEAASYADALIRKLEAK